MTLACPGALGRWLREIESGVRRKNDFDDLAAAAANEATGRQEEAAGRPGDAQRFYDLAWLRLEGCYFSPESDQAKAILRRVRPKVAQDTAAPLLDAPPRTPRRRLPRAGLELGVR